LLPLDVGCAHIDDAGEFEQRACCRRRNAMLAGAGLGDYAALAHSSRQQRLPKHVVYLVRASMVELVPLQIEFGASTVTRQPLREIQRAGAAYIMLEVIVEFGVKSRVAAYLGISLFDCENERHQSLGDVPSAIDPEMAALVRATAKCVR